MSLARLLYQTGKRADARRALAPVYAAFTQGQASSDLRQARVFLNDPC
jgi:hypothetical protein